MRAPAEAGDSRVIFGRCALAWASLSFHSYGSYFTIPLSPALISHFSAMKNLLTAPLSALALLALGGCATSGALTTSTETDGVYYSSSDHTTAVAPPAQVYSGSGNIPARALDDTVPAATTDDANPDYQGGTSRGYASGTDYYSNSYNDGLSYYTPSGFNQPYAGPGVSSYNYSPGWAVSPSFYGSPFGYGAGLAMGYGYSPYAMGGFGYPYGGGFYDSFYSPFYSPYGFGYGSSLSIGFGYGFGGFGGFGYPYGGYGYPYGYGGYGYAPYGYRGYGGSYGYGGYAGYAGEARYRNSAPRTVRGGSVANGYAPAGINNGNVYIGNGRRSGAVYTSGGRAAAPGTTTAPGYNPGAAGNNGGYNNATTVMPTRRDGGGGGNVVGNPTYSNPGGRADGYAAPNTSTAGAPQGTGRRGGFFNGFFGNGNGEGNATGSANPGGNYSQPQRRSYSQPQGMSENGYSQPQRSYQQPQQQMPQRRTFESAPQRSFSQPAYGGGGGGGSFGGGGGGGGGRRGGR